MPSNNINPLDKAVNLRQLQMSHDDLAEKGVQFSETADPAGEDVVNEYQRLTANLYQALEDAQQVIVSAREATEQAASVASRTQTAASQAQTATTQALQATSRADAATKVATVAAWQVEDAKGDYATLSARLDATEVGFIESTDPTSLCIFDRIAKL